NTFQAARHALEFKQLPSMHVKGKEHPVQVFMPTGVMINQKKDAVEDHPLLSWPQWSGKKQLREMMLPSAPYLEQTSLLGKSSKYNAFRPPLDYPVPTGPLFAHEWCEPFLPELQPFAAVGGVMVIRGKEGLGTHELAKLLGQIGRKDLKRQTFFISNMPDSVQMNIGNVPLLAWRKLCTEMVERWRVSDNREKKGYSKIDRDNSVYGLTKELIHPSFHWRLEDMKPVIHGLVLPYELPENQVMLKQRLKNLKSYQRRHGGMRHPLIMSPAINLLLKPAEWVGDAAAAAASAARVITPVNNWMRKLSSSQDDEVSDSDDSDDSGTGPPRLGLANVARGSGESIAPIIASLVNGFTLYESSIIILHVRTGTSVFAEMDRDSWKVARMVARVSLVRRSHRLENDMKDLKEWRRLHSRKCWWCKGYRTRTVVDSSGKEHLVQPTSLCRPLPSQFYQPLLFVLICSETTDNVPEQQQLVQMARDNNALIELKKLGLQETAAYLSHCLSIRKSGLDPGFVEYVQRASAGVPKYVYLTAKKLVTEQAVVLTPEGGVKKEARLSPRARRASGRRRSLSAAGPEEDRDEGDEGDRDDEDDDSQDEEDERREDDEVARCVCELIEKVKLQRDELAKAQGSANSQRGETDEGKLLPAPNDRWTHSAIYDRLPPDVRAPDAAALALDAPPLSAFDLGAMEEQMMHHGHRYDGSALDLGAGASGSELCPSQLYLASKYRERLHAGLSPDPSLGAGQTDSDASGVMDAKSRVGRQSGPGGESGEGGSLPSQRGSWPHHVHFDSGKETHAGQAGGGVRRKMGVAERQRLDDDARISRGKLTRAEYAFLQNAPPWVQLDAIDVKGLSLYKRRRWAAARNLEWDSDAECAVEAADDDATLAGHPAFLLQEGENGERRRRRTLYTGMVVKEDLLSLPFVPELIANCMFTVERLQPEEQMVAKVASVFPCAFTPVELCRAYPRRKPLEEFCAIIYQLIIRDVLEVCDPPSLEDLTSLAASIGVGGEGIETDMALDDSKLRVPGAAASNQAVRLSQSCLHNRSKRLSFLLNAASSSEGSGDPGEGAKAGNTLSPFFPGAGTTASQNRGSSGFSSASLLPPVARGGGTPSPSDQNSSSPGNSKIVGTHSGSLEHVPFPGLAPGHERRPSVMKAGGLVTPRRIVEGSLGGERAQPDGGGAPGTAGGPRDPQPSGRLTMAKAGTVVTREVWETVLMNEDGTDVFLRFNSIALQRVVSDLLLTDERKWLTLVCRRIIALRFTESPSSSKPSEPRAPADAAAAGVRLSARQEGVSEKGVSASAPPVRLEENRIDEGAEKEAEARDEAIEADLAREQSPPQSLLETALAAERETHEQAVKAEQAIAAKEQKDEIERLVSKAVLSRAGSGHLAGRKLSRKETATPYGSPIGRHSSASSRGAMSSEESEPVIHVEADEERGGNELWKRVSEESHLRSVTNGRPIDPSADR
ncbi:putative adenylate cyclase, partial [Toxoplasma gondii MAS]